MTYGAKTWRLVKERKLGSTQRAIEMKRERESFYLARRTLGQVGERSVGGGVFVAWDILKV